jgi:hypothetical protein
MTDRVAIDERPRRVQLSRGRGWRLPPHTIKVDRSTRWGNPFKVGEDGDAAQCVRLFRKLLTDPQFDLGSNHRLFMFTVDRLRADLRGFNLACWCALDEPCHADVLLEVANG